MALPNERLSASVSYYRDRLARALETMGVDRVDGQVPPSGYADEKAKWSAWCIDSLLWACEQFLQGRSTLALRGLLQATGYCGELGGFWPCPLAADATIVLRNAFEEITDAHDRVQS